jgi:hypothetical protein
MRQESIIVPCIAEMGIWQSGIVPFAEWILVKAPDLIPREAMYTCIEIIQEGPGSCPI